MAKLCIKIIPQHERSGKEKRQNRRKYVEGWGREVLRRLDKSYDRPALTGVRTSILAIGGGKKTRGGKGRSANKGKRATPQKELRRQGNSKQPNPKEQEGDREKQT